MNVLLEYECQVPVDGYEVITVETESETTQLISNASAPFRTD